MQLTDHYTPFRFSFINNNNSFYMFDDKSVSFTVLWILSYDGHWSLCFLQCAQQCEYFVNFKKIPKKKKEKIRFNLFDAMVSFSPDNELVYSFCVVTFVVIVGECISLMLYVTIFVQCCLFFAFVVQTLWL